MVAVVVCDGALLAGCDARAGCFEAGSCLEIQLLVDERCGEVATLSASVVRGEYSERDAAGLTAVLWSR